VLIQTHMAEHPLLIHLTEQGHGALPSLELGCPRAKLACRPFSFIALLRAEANNAASPMNFSSRPQPGGNLSDQLGLTTLDMLGPVPSPMNARGRYRAQTAGQASQRSALHQLLHHWLPQLESHPLGARCAGANLMLIRWTVFNRYRFGNRPTLNADNAWFYPQATIMPQTMKSSLHDLRPRFGTRSSLTPVLDIRPYSVEIDRKAMVLRQATWPMTLAKARIKRATWLSS